MVWLILIFHVFKRSLYASTGGKSFKLAKRHVFSERVNNCFIGRVTIIGNAFPDISVTVSSVSFKSNFALFDFFVNIYSFIYFILW